MNTYEQCPVCRLTIIGGWYEVSEHIKEQHPDKWKESRRARMTQPFEYEECPVCGMTCGDWDEVMIHMQDEHPEEAKDY